MISNAHAIGKVACCVVNDADLDSISKLLSTVALELSNTIRKIKPKYLTLMVNLRDIENGRPWIPWSDKVRFLEWLMSSISTLAGMLSSNSCYGNIHVATRLMQLVFPEKSKSLHSQRNLIA